MSRTESGPLSIFHDQKAMHALSIFHDWLAYKSERNLESSKLRRVISGKVESHFAFDPVYVNRKKTTRKRAPSPLTLHREFQSGFKKGKYARFSHQNKLEKEHHRAG
jgi:hypothetical protein